MSNKLVWIGIDVGKNTCVAAIDFPEFLDKISRKNVMGLPTMEFKSSQGGINSMLRWYDKLAKEYLANCDDNTLVCEPRVVMESTGIYSRKIEKYILSARATLQPVIENALFIKSYRQSLNLKNETDHIDARAIAYYGTERKPKAKAKSDEMYQQLCEICRLHDFYVAELTSYKNMHESLNTATLKRMDTSIIKFLERKLEELKRQMKKFVNEHEEIRQEVEIMISAPGVALLSAATLIGEYGSLKNYSTRNKLAAMSGLNPLIKESGTSIRRYRLSKKGSPLARRILYLNSTQAVRLDPHLKQFYESLIAKGKKPMTARCACMRKLLLMLRSMVINNQKYDPNYLNKFSEKKNKVA